MYFTVLSSRRLQNKSYIWYMFCYMLKTHHKMRDWHLPTEIVNFNTSYLKPYSFHSLTSLCPPCLTFLSLLSPPGSHSSLNHSLLLLARPYLNFFSCISPEGWARSWLFLRPCVRACVPLLGEAQNLCFCTILSEISENQYLATVALKTCYEIDTFFIKCLKHTIKWYVEIVIFNTSQLKS